MKPQGYGPEMIIVYGAVALSGFCIGILASWISGIY
jgi:hypothetical protein